MFEGVFFHCFCLIITVWLFFITVASVTGLSSAAVTSSLWRLHCFCFVVFHKLTSVIVLSSAPVASMPIMMCHFLALLEET